MITPKNRSGNRYKMADADLLDAVLARLQAMAVDGVAPSQKAWDDSQRDAGTPLPSKTALDKRLRIPWEQLVELAGLTLSADAVRRSAVCAARAPRAPRGAYRIAADDPPPFPARPAQEAREIAAFARVVAAFRRRGQVRYHDGLDGILRRTQTFEQALPGGAVLRRTVQFIEIR